MYNYKSDVIIVGGGLAGIIAAIELLDQGKKLLIIDRDTEANFGGLAKWAFGGMFFVDTKHQRKAKIQDSIELATRDWFAFAEFDEKEDWGPQWAKQYIQLCTPHGYRWLREKGVNFFPVLNWPERGMFEPGNSLPRFHMVWGTGWELTYVMIRQLQKHKNHHLVQYKFDHRVTAIDQKAGVISGVKGQVEKTGEEFSALADIVIIATGGINGSIERVKANWYKPLGDPPKTILNGAHEYAIGDLHDATSAINGNVVNLDKQWNYVGGIRHYKPRKPDHGLSIVPGKSQLWLNYQGRRFGPVPLMSPYDTRYLLEQICKQPVKYTWQLLNHKIACKEFAISGSEHNPAMRDKKFLKFVWTTLVKGQKDLVNLIARECEDFITAQSLEELVEKMNDLTGENYVNLEYIREAAQQYDTQINRGQKFHNDEQLRRIAYIRQYRGDRARTCKFQAILDPSARPLIAIRSFILSRKSLGGIQTDLQCKVLTTPASDGSQKPIEGLYAIGEAAGFGGGGIHGIRSLEGTFLGGCVITARVCAAAIGGSRLS